MDFREKKAVLVTGGRGFIGRAVTKQLRSLGQSVVSVDASSVASMAGEPELVCDITDRDGLNRVFAAHDIGAIVHLAAILPTAAQREPERATGVNIDASLNLLDLAQRFGVRRFVFGSSLSVYGTCPVDWVVSESRPPAPEDAYGAANVCVEEQGEALRQSGGPEFVSLRNGRVVGPGAHSTTSAWRSQIFEFLSAKEPVEIVVPYVGTETLLMVHVDDVAAMLCALVTAERPAHSVYNAACESVVVANLKRAIETLNPNILVRLGEAEAIGNPRRLDYSRYLHEFGFTPRPIFEQLKRSAQK